MLIKDLKKQSKTCKISYIPTGTGQDSVTAGACIPDPDITISCRKTCRGLEPWCPAPAATPHAAPASLGGIPPLDLRFAMTKAGHLSASTAAASRSGEGSASTHPPVSDAEGAATPASVLKLYETCRTRQALAKGYFDRPFMLRHALRLPDGSHVAVSPPVMMIPWVLPPCIAVTAADNGDILAADLSHCLYHRLELRLASPLPPEVAGSGAVLDIYISPMVDTTDGSRADSLTTYGRLATGANTGWRGRDHASGAPDCLAGRYDDGSGVHADHTVQSLGLSALTCLDLCPNPRLVYDLTGAAEFRLLASMPLAQLQPGSSFRPVPVDTAALTTMGDRPALADAPLSGATLTPEAECLYAGRRYCGGGSLSLPLPVAPEASCQYAGDPGAGAGECRVTVYTRTLGHRGMASATVTAPAAPPRYLYYPDPTAAAMAVDGADGTVYYPLTPHPRLHGAYWCGGLGTEPAPGDTVFPLTEGTDGDVGSGDVPCPGLIVASVPGSPRVAEAASAIDLGERVTALRAALEAPSRGSHGEFPLYAFTDRGIYTLSAAIPPRPTLFRLLAGAVAHRSIVTTDTGLAFIDGGRLWQLEGTKCTAAPMPAPTDILCRLPRLRQVLEASGVPDADIRALTGAPLFRGLGDGSPTLSRADGGADGGTDWWLHSCDRDDALLLASPAGGPAYALRPGSGEWTVLPVASAGGYGMLLTRAIPLGDDQRPGRLRGVKVDAAPLPDGAHRMLHTAVYGTPDMHHWHLLQTSATGRLECPTGSPVRAYRLLCVFRGTSISSSEWQ